MLKLISATCTSVRLCGTLTKVHLFFSRPLVKLAFGRSDLLKLPNGPKVHDLKRTNEQGFEYPVPPWYLGSCSNIWFLLIESLLGPRVG